MDSNPYASPDFAPGFYPKDKTWGLIVMVLSSLGLCLGSVTLLIGGAIGVFGSAAVTRGGSSDSDSQNAALATGGIGALIAVIGIAIALSSLIQVAGGFGIMRSRRWGFVLTGVLAGISLLLGLASLPHGIIHIAINAVIGWYCWSRLSGKDGPAPM